MPVIMLCFGEFIFIIKLCACVWGRRMSIHECAVPAEAGGQLQIPGGGATADCEPSNKGAEN